MKQTWLLLILFLLPTGLYAEDRPVQGRVVHIAIQPGEVTHLHLRAGFESSIHLPEDVTSVVLGDPGAFKAEHNEGEPRYVYVKPTTTSASQSNLLIATKSGLHVALQLISDGRGGDDTPVDFLIEYAAVRSLFLPAQSTPSPVRSIGASSGANATPHHEERSPGTSSLDKEFQRQLSINAPNWTNWNDQRVQTSLGSVEQRSNEMVVAYSIFNASKEAVEIVPPQIQMTGVKPAKKQKKGKGIISDQLEIRDFKLSATRLEPGARADGVVEFDRPNFKESTEKLFLQVAQADQVDRPILIRLPFTAPTSMAVQ